MTILTCTLCGRRYPADRLQTVCPEDARPLRVDLDLTPETLDRAALKDREPTM